MMPDLRTLMKEFEPKDTTTQKVLLAGGPLTMRDEANAIILHVLRNGFLEDFHEGPDAAIGQEDMKKLMIETTARLAHWLLTRDGLLRRSPNSYAIVIANTMENFTGRWEREALTYESRAPAVPPCSACKSAIRETWRFCPACGAATGSRA